MRFRIAVLLLVLTIVAMFGAAYVALQGYLYTALALVAIGIALGITIVVTTVRGKDW